MKVPNKLLITRKHLEKYEILKKMQEKAPEWFEENLSNSDFYCLTLFLMFEKGKGKDSFYFPIF